MPLDLHASCQKRLVEVFSDHLPNIVVKNRSSVERGSLLPLTEAEEVLPKTGKLRDELVTYIDDFPVFEFVYETISRDLFDRDEYESDAPDVPLTDLDGYHDPVETAQFLANSFNSLPWEYTLSIKLPSGISEVFRHLPTELTLSDTVRIVRPNPDFAARFPLTSGNERKDRWIHGGPSLVDLAAGAPEPEWDDQNSYLQIDTIGFVGQWGTSAPLAHAVAMLRAFCGLAIALRLFKIHKTFQFSIFGGPPKKPSFLVHKRREDRWEIDRKFELQEDVAELFDALSFYDHDILDSQAKKVAWSVKQLDLVRLVFSNSRSAEKIVLGSQWLFDSYVGRNELLSFVQTMVVLEILLGEESSMNQIGLGQLLRNRCAYLIGKSHDERLGLLKIFSSIYDVRSQIVHRGKSRLTPHERELFDRLQWICRRVLYEEIVLLQADQKDK